MRCSKQRCVCRAEFSDYNAPVFSSRQISLAFIIFHLQRNINKQVNTITGINNNQYLERVRKQLLLKKLTIQWRILGGRPWRAPPTAQNFLNFMQFFAKFGKIICWRPPWRVGAPSYGESWIRPCNMRCHLGSRISNSEPIH